MNILMPQLGETVAEGKVAVWYKSVGDKVSAGENLFEIETDKTSMEVPSTVAGVLSEIRVAAGDTVPVGAVVAVLDEPARTQAPATASAAAASLAAKAPLDPFNPVRTPERNFGPATRTGGVKVTPVARRLAAQAGVDLDKITSSGPHGHIMAKDVQAAAARARVAAPAIAAGAAPAAAANSAAPPSSAQAPGPAPAAGLTAAQVKAAFEGVPFETVPVDNMRRTIARRLLESKQNIPHFYLSIDVAMDRLTEVRTELNAQAGGAFKLSINDFIIKAVALALRQVPEANAVWAEDSILRFKQSDVAVAVAVQGGLFTPVIRQAEAKSLSSISTEMKALIERANAKDLKPSDYRGGSITISNLGMYGVRSFAAIVNAPQAAILAVGAAERRPMEGPNGAIRFGSVMTVTLSSDHRVIDGALGARLLAAFKTLLEAPVRLFV